MKEREGEEEISLSAEKTPALGLVLHNHWKHYKSGST